MQLPARGCDILELSGEIGLPALVIATGQRVAYHSAWVLQHGRQVRLKPKLPLAVSGFKVVDVPGG